MGEEKKTFHIIDARDTEAYANREEYRVVTVELLGARTFINVPMLRGDELLGVIGIYRDEVRPFDAREIALVENFAKQAAIAIDNARLLNELRARTAELSELLQQQTASTEVLRLVSSTPGELSPVFDAILANAARIASQGGTVFRYQDGAYTARRAPNRRKPRNISPRLDPPAAWQRFARITDERKRFTSSMRARPPPTATPRRIVWRPSTCWARAPFSTPMLMTTSCSASSDLSHRSAPVLTSRKSR